MASIHLLGKGVQVSDQQNRAMALDDVLSFNDQVLALAKTGLPFELAPGDDLDDLSRKLTQANFDLALETGRGRPLAEALAAAPELTPRYRAALETWYRCDRSVDAFDTLIKPAVVRRRIQADVGISFLQPLIVLLLVYCAFTYLVLVTAPKLESLYTQTWQTPSRSLQFLTAARQTQPIWGVIVPLALVATVVMWKWRAAQWQFHWLPWRSGALSAIGKANYAENIASLVDQNYSLGQSLSLLGPLPAELAGQRETAPAIERLIEAERLNEPVALHDPTLAPLPPLLRWAFTSGLAGRPLANVLRFTSKTYLQAADRNLSFWRTWLPIILSATIGGLLVLLYSLSLFVPMVELLKSLTRP